MSQTAGRIAVVTGATGGIGFETALGLAARGITTILAGRNPDKGAAAVARIRGQHPGAEVRFEPLDLASLASVARFAAAQTAVDILVNNGAVMGLPTRQTTEDGLERQVGVNYLAHFALTGRLLPVLRTGARIVNVASLAHRRADLHLDDFLWETSYAPMRVYAQTKLAMLVFTLELNRRLRNDKRGIVAVAAHPGWSRTNIIPNGYGVTLKARIARMVFDCVAQSAHDGALPILYAALARDAEAGGYYGPSSFGETRGGPAVARIFPQAREIGVGERLWALSERYSGVIPEVCG